MLALVPSSPLTEQPNLHFQGYVFDTSMVNAEESSNGCRGQDSLARSLLALPTNLQDLCWVFKHVPQSSMNLNDLKFSQHQQISTDGFASASWL